MEQELNQLRELLQAHRQSLHYMEMQEAKFGPSMVPPHILNDISATKDKIKSTEQRIKEIEEILNNKLDAQNTANKRITAEKSMKGNNETKRPGQRKYITVDDTREESYITMLAALNSARSSIDIVSHEELLAADTRRTGFYKTLREAVEGRQVNHRRIIWNADHVSWLEQILDNGWDYFPEFSVKFYIPKRRIINLCTFDLYDNKAVIFTQGWAIEGSTQITHPQTVKRFHEYFTSLWKSSEVIKQHGQRADREKLRQIVEGLPQ